MFNLILASIHFLFYITIIIGDLYLIKKFNNRNDFYFDISCSLCAWEQSAYQLIEAEIKAIDERYWPFAVPVEEVAER
ncbi:hypothetical protein PML82_05635 [Enterococcus faecium]|nr:hypothetical protein [Enterococcus faecium]WCG11230.1 hypothetical protein PML82_05635 [Enterococcus faecium]